MFESLYLPVPDADLYLRRMRYGGPVRTGRDALDLLIRAHLMSVPFENIDIYDRHRPIELGIPALFHKIVTRSRGGYCFELNGLFMALLTALGFSCHAVAVRVLWNKDHYPPLSHRATIVTVDGKRYFCDVGFGGPMADRSLELDAAGGQTAGTGVFRFSPNGREIMLCMSSGEGDVPLLSFSDLPADPVDFVALNHYCSRSPESPFLSSRRVHLLTERGRVSLENNVFRRTGSPPVVLRTRDQTARTLAGVFGIEVDKNDLKL